MPWIDGAELALLKTTLILLLIVTKADLQRQCAISLTSDGGAEPMICLAHNRSQLSVFRPGSSLKADPTNPIL